MPFVPMGSDQIAGWAAFRGLAYQACPDEAWFRNWEPFDTIAPPTIYVNSCTWHVAPPDQITVVEPWYAPEDGTPLDRTLLGFATCSRLRYRASARAGEHFLTRVAFLENPPPPEIQIGDELWDRHVKTFARNAPEAARGFHRRLRRLLAGWGFSGHLELRRGGLVCHYAGLVPSARDYDRMQYIMRDIVNAAVSYPE
jgi:hypothetical protein